VSYLFIVKNALKSISRSKIRNILIGIIVLVIALSSCVALSIRNSANELVKQQKENYTITATLGVDRSAIMKQSQSGSTDMQTIMSSIPALTLANLKNYANSTYVKSLSYNMSTSVDSSNVTSVSNSTQTSSSSSTTSSGKSNSAGGQQNYGGSFGGQSQGDFKLVGYSSTAAMSDFVNGTYKMTSGTMFSDSDIANDCVITDELAKANSLTVGSKITLTNPKDTTQTSQFTVVGIYTDTTTSDGSQMNLYSNAANQIITNYTAANKIVTASTSNTTTELTSQLSSSFTLNNADNLTAFEAQLTAKGLNKYYTVTSNVDSFTQSVAPLNNLSNYASIFLLIVLIIGGIILVVLNMFNIRERKYEVGVLRAIGMKKGKVALQFITELFVVTFIALSIGAAAGAASSVPVANYMLKSEISSLQSQQSQVQQNFGRQGGQGGGAGQSKGIGGFFGTSANVSYVNQINAVINGRVLLQIAGIGILLTILSSGISMIFISRYEPLKILSSRT
jgi:putative ABC transport system permease protein